MVIKLGGIGMPRTGFDWHERDVPASSEELASDMAPLVNYCIEQFGPDRCMFESNFPVDKVSYSYNVMYNAFKRAVQGLLGQRAGGDVPRHGGAGVLGGRELDEDRHGY